MLSVIIWFVIERLYQRSTFQQQWVKQLQGDIWAASQQSIALQSFI